MNAKSWIQLTLSLPASYQDLLTGQLAAIGFCGFHQENGTLNCYIPRSQWTNNLHKKVERFLCQFGSEFPNLHLRFRLKLVKQRNWNKIWEKSVGVVDATDKIVIKPSWRKRRRQDQGKITIEIDPKMSFGTGHHESTRLTLRLLQEYLQHKSRVLDFGCGTGILAISAAKLGAHSVVAIDNDDWATSNARENIRRNRVTGKIRILNGGIRNIPSRAFELIVANIDLPTILHSLHSFVRHLKPGGILLLSGLLVKDLSVLLPELSHRSLVPLELMCENEWTALALVRS